MIINSGRMDLPTVGLLEQLTVAQAGRHCRVSVPSEAPCLSHNKIPTLGRFLLCLGRLWGSCCMDTHPSPKILLFFKEQHALCAREWGCVELEKRGANSSSGPLSFLLSVCLYLDCRHSPWCCLSAPDSSRSSTGFLLCFGRLNLHSHCLAWAICRLIFTKSALWSP